MGRRLPLLGCRRRRLDTLVHWIVCHQRGAFLSHDRWGNRPSYRSSLRSVERAEPRRNELLVLRLRRVKQIGGSQGRTVWMTSYMEERAGQRLSPTSWQLGPNTTIP